MLPISRLWATAARCWDMSGNLHNALRAMAPKDDWDWLRRIARLLRRTVEPVRDKRPRIVPSDQLFSYGIELMIEADGPSGGTPLKRSIRYRDGLMIALLAAEEPPLKKCKIRKLKVTLYVLAR